MIARFRLSLLFILCFGLTPAQPVQTYQGTPSLREYTYGVSINPLAPSINEALLLAAELDPDWLLVAFDWQLWYPTRDAIPEWQPLDETLHFAKQQNLGVCLRISNAPAWALTNSGPDHQATLALLHTLLERYAGSILAVEIFPGANTSQGWGAPPSAGAYQALTQSIAHFLQQSGSNLTLVAGGLVFADDFNPAEQINGLEFLQGLYDAGIKNTAAILSLQLVNLSDDPFQHANNENQPVLRHIDAVRQIMLQNDHEQGLVWITTLSIQPGDSNGQIGNLTTACSLLRSRLFVGAVVPAAVNTLPPSFPSPTVLQAGAEKQPLFTELYDLITRNRLQNHSPAASRQKETTGLSKETYVHDQPNPFQYLLARFSDLSCTWFGHCQ
jgi:hypothetical protein